MTGRFEGKVALVTGGANGIGRACCERFAEEGAAVVVADVLDEPGEDVATTVGKLGAGAVFVHVDAASPQDNEAAAATAVEQYGRLDVLVTAAGISHGGYRSGDLETDRRMFQETFGRWGHAGASLLHLELTDWQKVLDVNLTGTFLAARAAARRMIDGGTGGAIVTIASVAAKRPDAGPLAYCVSKAGVWMLTKTLARDLAPGRIRVNAIGPGLISTNMTRILTEMPGIESFFMPQIPMARAGEPSEIASVAAFLASDDASYVTGEIIHPDGGFYTE